MNDFTDLSHCVGRQSHTNVIFIREFKVATLIGVYPHERRAPQTVQLDLDIGLPKRRRWTSDDIGETVDYGGVVQQIRAVLEASRFHLLETLAERVADVILDEFEASWVRVRVAKLGILSNVGEVGICIERDRTQRAETITRETLALIDA